jgi:ABC-type Na+ efflux pump permease subunit
MNRSRALYHTVRADFLERVRRYSFLLTLGFSVYLGYTVYAGQVTLRLANYSGVNNSAWLGSVIGLVGSVWLTLIGFYVVKNSIQRDRQTRVGQILATTPISKSFYTLAKTLSNFVVLAAMIFVLALAALVIQLSQRTGASINVVALVSPVLIFGLSAVAVTAALAVLFESLPVLRGGVGNILYFFLWTVFLIAFGAGSLG